MTAGTALLYEISLMVDIGMICQKLGVTLWQYVSHYPLPMDPDAAVQIMSLTYVPLVYV